MDILEKPARLKCRLKLGLRLIPLTLAILAALTISRPTAAQEPIAETAAAPTEPIRARGTPGPNPLLHDPQLTESQPRFLPNQWALRTVGESIELGDFPASLRVSPDGKLAAVVCCGYREHQVQIIDLQKRAVVSSAPLACASEGLAWGPDGRQLFVTLGGDGALGRFSVANGSLSELTTIPVVALPEADASPGAEPGGVPGYRSSDGSRFLSGLALTADGLTAYVTALYSNRLLRVPLTPGTTETVRVVCTFEGSHAAPHSVILHPSRNLAYVSLLGASAVAEVNLNTGAIERIPAFAHPMKMAITKDGRRLFVACANSNSVVEIDTKWRSSIDIDTALYPNAPVGSTPSAVSLSDDGVFLAVANSDNNLAVLFDIRRPGEADPIGYIPTGWYPTDIAMLPDTNMLVLNGKGNGSRPNPGGPQPTEPDFDRSPEYIGGLFPGTAQFVGSLSRARMWELTKLAYKTSPLRGDFTPTAAEQVEESNPVPKKAGAPTPIRHVVYIIKEGRTYDQVFGDMERGSGYSPLCLFGKNVTPNHHAIAEQYVLLDNFYTEGEVTADGQEWSTAAYATAFVERIWPTIYRGRARLPYPSEGRSVLGASRGGYLWDRAADTGITYRTYGLWVTSGEAPCSALPLSRTVDDHFAPCYAPFDLGVTDQNRADRFLAEVNKYNEEALLPQLTVLRLGNDHTSGTKAGALTPRAYVADNDEALGTILEGLSKTRFWKSMAVFVVEDDAQNGPDHRDAHRSVALVAGPFVKRGKVISTHYSTSSVLRTIGLILGLDPMSQYDAAALPMYDCFTGTPNVGGYEKRRAEVGTGERNDTGEPGTAGPY